MPVVSYRVGFLSGLLAPSATLRPLLEAGGSTLHCAEPLSEVVGANLDALREPETIELRVPDGTRHFEAPVSPVRDRYERQPGHAVVITDVTQERAVTATRRPQPRAPSQPPQRNDQHHRETSAYLRLQAEVER